MNLTFKNRRTKQINMRLTEEEHKVVKSLARKHKESVSETAGVLLRAALREVKQSTM